MADENLVEQYEQILIKVIQARYDDDRDLEEEHLCHLDEIHAKMSPAQRIEHNRIGRKISDLYLNPGGMPHTRPPN